MTEKPLGPVILELDDEGPSPAEALPPPDAAPAEGRAMQTLATLSQRSPSRLARLFWGAFFSLLTLALGVAFWDFAAGLLSRSPILGWTAAGLGGVLVIGLLVAALGEIAALARLGRLETLRAAADAAIAAKDVTAARKTVSDLEAFYGRRSDVRWGSTKLAEAAAAAVDADALIHEAEGMLLRQLDAFAIQEVEGATRRVAAVTALAPVALVDVAVALFTNLRMIRRIAEIYGNRSGTIGAWRLIKAVLTHLAATGMIAVGDDVVSHVAGGGVLSKVSRRFGEGLVNGALTARVGVSAIEVCRPLAFRAEKRPSVTSIVRRALVGVFDTGKDPE